MKYSFFKSLFWKITAAFLVILFILSGVYVYISVYSAEMYFQETRQKLDTDIASHIAQENQCFINGEVNEDVLKNVFHNVMVVNPSIEVYLLDTDGKILTYYAPNHVVKIDKVPLEPIEKFININDSSFLMGIDPKNPKREKAFSAAQVLENGKLMGYIYVILEGEVYENTSELLFGSYILKLGIRSMGIALFFAIIISFFAVGLITRNLRKIINVVRDFKNGNLNARIKFKTKDELSEFAQSFNEMADTIVKNIDEIKKIDSLRRDLIANVSHDLRTPLSIIQGYLETILIKSESLSDDEKKKYLTTSLSSTKRLMKLVEELFELSKLETQQIEPHKELFSIAELVQDIHRKNIIITESKNLKLDLDVESNIPMVYADIGMIEKVIQNILDNAIKFTPEGGKISLKLKKVEQNVEVIISDSGHGIPDDELPHIFDRYHKIKRVKESDQEGTGLGLAIVKKIVELHDSKIIVESEINEGTTFRFLLNSHNNPS